MEASAFTDAVRMYRQSKEQYGTWDMLCGNEIQVRVGATLGWEVAASKIARFQLKGKMAKAASLTDQLGLTATGD